MTEIDTIDLVKSNSIRASKEGFSILDALKSGDLSLTEASEYSNAIGKINAANGNILKADLITLAIDKADGDRVKRLVQNEEAIA
jgi:hypothetical protein